MRWEGMENWKEEGWERWVGGSYDIFYYGIRGIWFGFSRNRVEVWGCGEVY